MIGKGDNGPSVDFFEAPASLNMPLGEICIKDTPPKKMRAGPSIPTSHLKNSRKFRFERLILDFRWLSAMERQTFPSSYLLPLALKLAREVPVRANALMAWVKQLTDGACGRAGPCHQQTPCSSVYSILIPGISDHYMSAISINVPPIWAQGSSGWSQNIYNRPSLNWKMKLNGFNIKKKFRIVRFVRTGYVFCL